MLGRGGDLEGDLEEDLEDAPDLTRLDPTEADVHGFGLQLDMVSTRWRMESKSTASH
jgi:hypothetical protein